MVEDPLGYVDVPAGEPVHIAYWGVLSGADASLGEDSKQGVQIAVNDLATFKGHEILLTTEDGLCSPEGGATAATKLAADSTIVGLVGSACSDEVVGGIKTLTEAGLTTISPSVPPNSAMVASNGLGPLRTSRRRPSRQPMPAARCTATTPAMAVRR